MTGMNTEIEMFAREELIKGLSKCTNGQKLMFKRMYAQSAGITVNHTIQEIVAKMPKEKLGWALEQVNNTLAKTRKDESMIFKYTALDRNAKEVTGTVEAASQKEAISKIRAAGEFPVKIQQTKEEPKKVAIKDTTVDMGGTTEVENFAEEQQKAQDEIPEINARGEAPFNNSFNEKEEPPVDESKSDTEKLEEEVKKGREEMNEKAKEAYQQIYALIALLEMKVEEGIASDADKLYLDGLKLLVKHDKTIGQLVTKAGEVVAEWFGKRQANKPINRLLAQQEETNQLLSTLITIAQRNRV